MRRRLFPIISVNNVVHLKVTSDVLLFMYFTFKIFYINLITHIFIIHLFCPWVHVCLCACMCDTVCVVFCVHVCLYLYPGHSCGGQGTGWMSLFSFYSTQVPEFELKSVALGIFTSESSCCLLMHFLKPHVSEECEFLIWKKELEGL